MMHTRRRNSHLSTLIILGVLLPGLIGIFAIQARAIADQAAHARLVLQASSSPTWTITPSPLPSLTSTGAPFTDPSFVSSSSLDLYTFIQAPAGAVSRPYVTLLAFASVVQTGLVQVRGFINSDEFICTEAPCVVYLDASARLVFRAYARTGESSDEVIATVTVTQVENGYLVNIDAVSQFTSFTDSCAAAWNVRDEANASWDNFVQFPYELNTSKTLHTLAAKLILNGVVDASSCPTGGLSIGLDWPTACGLEKAADAVTVWQNQFDEYIWLASRNHGIPPKILKTLIEFETQFWPANSRFYVDEIGLGQINQLGVDVLLRRDPAYYNRVCAAVGADCSRPYNSLEPAQQASVRGAVLASVDATCPTCEYGLDLNKAKQSVDLIASLLKANCQQVDAILKLPVKPDPVTATVTTTATAPTATSAAGGTRPGATYEDLWRFTLASYHTGINCFQNASNELRKTSQTMNWENLTKTLACKNGITYVDGFMNNLTTFDIYLYQPREALLGLAVPTIVPTRTPVPTPTVYASSARLIVQVYMDRNGNGLPDPGEWIDAMTVQVTISNADPVTQRTQNGIAIFDMTGYRPGSGIDVSLPGLYRNQVLLLPESGDVTVTFKFDQPALPTSLP